MKERLIRRMSVCLLLSILVFLFCNFKNTQNVSRVYAEEPNNVEFSIISPNFSLGVASGSEERSPFTPINKETGFRFGDENNCFSYSPSLNAIATVGDNSVRYIDKTFDISGLNLNDVEADYEKTALQFWLYIEDEGVRDFNIILGFADGDEIKWGFDYERIQNAIIDADPFKIGLGWNLINIDFASGNINDGGDIYNELLKLFDDITTLKIVQIVDGNNVREVSMMFYDLKIITNNTQNGTQIIEKQPYICYFFDFDAFYGGLNTENYVGDVWDIPNLIEQSKSYFWYGKLNIISSVFLRLNNASDEIKVGEKYTFSEVGKQSFVVCGKNSEGEKISIQESLSSNYIESYVYQFVPISISFDSLKAFVDDEYEIEFYISDKFDNVENLNVQVDNDSVIVKRFDIETKTAIIKAEKVGNSVLTISFSGTRNGVSNIYSKNINITTKTKSDVGNMFLWIFCGVGLSVCLGLGMFYGIKAIVNANKYNVK